MRWVERLGAGLAAVAVNAVVLIWELARMDFLTVRGLVYSLYGPYKTMGYVT